MSKHSSSVFDILAPSEAVLQALEGEMDGKISRNVNGFYRKYFEGKSWSTVVEDRIRGKKAMDLIRKLSPDLSGISNFSAIADWLVDLQDLFYATNQAKFRWQSHQLSSMNGKAHTGISLDVSDHPCVAGSTRAFGEFYHARDTDSQLDDNITVRFCARAQQIFTAQSARCFLHGFLVHGTLLELWIFDRSGAFSGKKLDLARNPDSLVRVLAGYTLMSEAEVGLNTFVEQLGNRSDGRVTFNQHGSFYLQSDLIATSDDLVGPGTTCYGASRSRNREPSAVVKFSWRDDEEFTEARILELARDRKAWGVVQLIAYEDLLSTASIRQGLSFSRGFDNRIFSCMVTGPLGRPLRHFTCIPELLEALRDHVRALQSLYLDARILHRDVAIKNLIIVPQNDGTGPKGVLIDFNFALDLDHVRPIEPLVGSDGFMAIGILFGEQHTYRHDLESLFYVFLWIAISNDRMHDEAIDILEGLSESSRLQNWCSMDFASVGENKLADMTPEGFPRILDEFSMDFVPLRSLAQELHALLFPIRNGELFTGTQMSTTAIRKLYDGMADAFHASARTFHV